jgi:RNA polymerase sigma-70 factor (ECF subfamily)
MTHRPAPWAREEPASLGLLVQRARAGQSEAFGSLALHLRPFVAGLVARLTPPGADRDDLVQETFVRAWTHLAELSEPDAVRGWIGRIAARLALEAARRRRREAARERAVAEERATEARGPDHSQLRDEARRLLEAAIARLPARRRLAFHLRIGEGLSHAEVARVLDTTIATTRIYVCKARAQLARELAPHRDLLHALGVRS